MKTFGKYHVKTNQDGVASIIVVTILIVLLSLINVGFARLMSRTVNNSSNRQQNSAAYYAAQSGINEITSDIKKAIINDKPPISGCSDANLGTLDTDISDDGVTTYSCNNITSSPTDLAFQAIPPNRTQVARLETGSRISPVLTSQLMFSWQSTDRDKGAFPTATTPFLDETTWNSSNNAPILRITLYPIPSGGALSGTQLSSKTFFLVPSTASDSPVLYSTADGAVIRSACSKTHYRTVAGFSGTSDYDCDTVITGFSTTPPIANFAYMYVTLTPIYGQADVKIKANDSALKILPFFDAQSMVDVTGRSGNASKRLQARINTSLGEAVDWQDNAVPDQALRSAMTICKRLTVGGTTVKGDSDTQSCGLTLSP